MKKVIMLAVAALGAALLATSCCNCDKNGKCCKEGKDMPQGPEGAQCPQGPRGERPAGPMPGECCPAENPEMKACCEKWAKFDSLSVDEQKAFLKEQKENIDKREAEMAAKKAEMDAKWANFDNLSVDEQKELIMMKCPKKGGMHAPKGPKGDECQGPRPEGGHRGGPRPDAPQEK